MNHLQFRHLSRLLVVVFAVVAPLATHAQQQPSIVVTETSISVSNVTRGSSILLASCSRSSEHGRLIVANDVRVVPDADRDGHVVFIPSKGVEVRSVWVALDIESGASAIGAPANFPLRVESMSSDSLRKNAAGEIAELLHDLPRLYVLLLRPGQGAWAIRAVDGQQGDGDGKRDRKVKIVFEDLLAIHGKEKAPKSLKADDIIVAIDPARLDVVTARIAK